MARGSNDFTSLLAFPEKTSTTGKIPIRIVRLLDPGSRGNVPQGRMIVRDHRHDAFAPNISTGAHMRQNIICRPGVCVRSELQASVFKIPARKCNAARRFRKSIEKLPDLSRSDTRFSRYSVHFCLPCPFAGFHADSPDATACVQQTDKHITSFRSCSTPRRRLRDETIGAPSGCSGVHWRAERGALVRLLQPLQDLPGDAERRFLGA